MIGGDAPLNKSPKNAMKNPITSTTFSGGTTVGTNSAHDTQMYEIKLTLGEISF
jgi:hypothetical protein